MGRRAPVGAATAAVEHRGRRLEPGVDDQRQHRPGGEQREGEDRRGEHDRADGDQRGEPVARGRPDPPGAAALGLGDAGFGPRREGAVTGGDQRGLDVGLGGDGEVDPAEACGQHPAERRELGRPRTDHHRGAAHPLPRQYAVADADFGPQRVDQPGVGGLGGEVGDGAAVLLGQPAVERLLGDHAMREEDVAEARLFAFLQRHRAGEVAGRECTRRDQDVPERTPARGGTPVGAGAGDESGSGFGRVGAGGAGDPGRRGGEDARGRRGRGRERWRRGEGDHPVAVGEPAGELDRDAREHPGLARARVLGGAGGGGMAGRGGRAAGHVWVCSQGHGTPGFFAGTLPQPWLTLG